MRCQYGTYTTKIRPYEAKLRYIYDPYLVVNDGKHAVFISYTTVYGDPIQLPGYMLYFSRNCMTHWFRNDQNTNEYMELF